MTSPSFITVRKLLFAIAAALASASGLAASPYVAYLTPDGTAESKEYARTLAENSKGHISPVDEDMADAAFRARGLSQPYNLTTEEAKLLGRTIGDCVAFTIIRAAVQRRSSSDRSEYYEAYAVIYLVSSGTGRLVYWQLKRFDAATGAEAWKALIENARIKEGESVGEAAVLAGRAEYRERPVAAIEEVPEANSPLAKNFKAPVPFKRIKPEYTETAALYDVTATVEIEVDLDAEGKILRTGITRWAGFGLDESVDRAVRSMNWRPAERNAKFIPMRFLLRYNFKKLPKE